MSPVRKKKIVAFQGMRGAYSEQACRERLPEMETLPCRTFDEVFAAVERGDAHMGMLPVENSTAGVISDSYDLLKTNRLHIVGEHYQRVRHCLLGMRGGTREAIRVVCSHPQALAQCHQFLQRCGWEKRAVYDTAGAAAELARRGDPTEAAIASELCAGLYGLELLEREIQDNRLNTTRFILIAKEAVHPEAGVPCKTSLLFEARHIPAALYKCLGGFATNGINLTKLEARPIPGQNWTYHFYLDFQGRPDEPRRQLALEELAFYTTSVKILGCYPESPPVPDGEEEGGIASD
ncbi:MAG: prephenate dehydratase [Magnetococcales bacterium]|nr:prephenate dehydratase [Magnetococcales bacterium]